MHRIKPNAPFRDIRRGCCGCWVLLVLLLLAMLAASCLLGLALSRGMTPAAHAASPGDRQAIRLAPVIPAAANRSTPYGVFFTNRVTVEVAPGSVLLASTADGSGQIMTDDQATIQIVHADGSSTEWSWDFRTRDHSGVTSLPAQDLTALFHNGLNEVTITLRDLTPYTYSSLAYYIIFTVNTAPPPTPSVVRPTASPSSIPMSTRGDSPAAPTHPSLAIEGAVDRVTPINTSTPISVTATPAPLIANTDVRAEPDWTWAVVLGGGMLLAGITILSASLTRRSQRAVAPPALFGWMDLHDSQTRESHPPIDLARWPQGLGIQLDPLQVKPLGDGAQAIAEIRPTTEGAVLSTKDGPIVITSSQQQGSQAADLLEGENQLLQDGMQVTVGGRLELGYRNPRQTFEGSETWFVSYLPNEIAAKKPRIWDASPSLMATRPITCMVSARPS